MQFLFLYKKIPFDMIKGDENQFEDSFNFCKAFFTLEI